MIQRVANSKKKIEIKRTYLVVVVTTSSRDKSIANKLLLTKTWTKTYLLQAAHLVILYILKYISNTYQ